MKQITKYSPKRYREAVNNAYMQGEFAGESVSSKQEIYERISDELHKSYDTVRKWANPKSNGSGDPKDIYKLEELFGVSLREETSKDPELSCSECAKESIRSAYSIIKEYINSEAPEEEERFIEMINSIDKIKIAIPTQLFEQIQEFINAYLRPMVYDYLTVFSEEFSEEFGEWGENGTFCIKEPDTKGRFMKMLEIHVRKIMEIEEEFDKFAIEHMQPYIL